MKLRLSTARFAVHPDGASGARGCAPVVTAAPQAAASSAHRQHPVCLVVRMSPRNCMRAVVDGECKERVRAATHSIVPPRIAALWRHRRRTAFDTRVSNAADPRPTP
jgi:hypothetical protein